MAIYDIMYYNTPVAVIDVAKDSYEVVDYDPSIKCVYHDIDDLVDQKLNVNMRSAVLNMMSSTKVLKEQSVDLDAFTYWTHCVSATDNFWLRLRGESTKWEEVSPLRDRLDPDIAMAAAYGRVLDDKKLKIAEPLSIEATTASVHCQFRGSTDKIILSEQSGRLNLFKSCGVTNSQNENVATYMESIAYGLAKQLDASGFVNYNVFENKLDNGDIRVFSGCKLFTGAKINSVPLLRSRMHDFKMKQLMGMMDGKCIDTVCNMMIVDSLLVNIGRSIGDIDMLYGDTFNILGVAPIFDFDNCLGWDIELEGKSIKDAVEEANARVNSNLGITFDEQAAAFADKDTAARLDAVDLDKLEADRMQGKLGLSEKRKEFIKALLRKRIEQVRAAITRSRIRG